MVAANPPILGYLREGRLVIWWCIPGPLHAAADLNDAHHLALVEALAAPERQLILPALGVAEASAWPYRS